MEVLELLPDIVQVTTRPFWISIMFEWVPAVYIYWPVLLGVACVMSPKFRGWILFLLKLLFGSILKEFFQDFEKRLMDRMDNDAMIIKEDIQELKVDVKSIEGQLSINTDITMDMAIIQIKDYCRRIKLGDPLSPMELAIMKRLFKQYKMLDGNGELEEMYNDAMDVLARIKRKSLDKE